METLYDFFAKPTDPKLYTGVRLELVSPEDMRQWSHGEIKKPETINYRTFKPERDGLFCAKIFGPTKDYECNCGKYKRMKHRGVICEKCGVEVIQSKVRRERMGHIELAAPVAHIWFLKSLPSKIGNILDMTLKDMEKILYFDSYIVTNPKETDLTKGQLLSDEKYFEALEQYDAKFEVGIGAEAVKQLLDEQNLSGIYTELREDIRATNSTAKRQKLAKRLKIIDSFKRSEINPAYMIFDIVPVLPPDLRPLVPLEGGRFATSDLNDLYRRVINRNNRLKRLTDLKAPDIIVRNEKRMLQESVDVLFDNGRHGRVITGTNKRPLKSLSDTLKGKQGRFRQNLLGKRVDYSGRTVITTGPNLKLHQCGLPKKMALELFKPFVYYRLEAKGIVSTVKSAKKLVERESFEVWDTLDEVVKEYPVMLNRAPTLHRLGIQAFEPILIEGKAIQLHPLVCTAFNADFDGDQMAVHIPLSVESQIEARVLMLASNNILSPANGVPIIIPSQDIVLGLYYLTLKVKGDDPVRIFSNLHEVRCAYDSDAIGLHSPIKIRIQGQRYETTAGRTILWEIIPKEKQLEMQHIRVDTQEKAQELYTKIESGTEFVEIMMDAGMQVQEGNLGFISEEEFNRIFNFDASISQKIFALEENQISDIITCGDACHIFKIIHRKPEVSFEIVNDVMDKQKLRNLIDYIYRSLGLKATVILSDRLKDLGYSYSTIGGISISIEAMIIPDSKWKILNKADTQVTEIDRQYSEGLITQGEKYNKIVDIWAKATDDVADAMMASMKKPSGQANAKDKDGFNPVYMMAESGARGSKDQMRQLAGMRGLMAKPSGEIIETPITANFREGLSVLQYFISTHGARKGLADTALKTANSGYLTRRLADVAQDCSVMEEDCGTMVGIEVEPLIEGGEIIQRLGERILGRVVVGEDIIYPFTDKILARVGDELDEEDVAIIEKAGITKVKIRSVLTCRCKSGICIKCYGRDLAHGHPVEIGQAAGILAAQSIGEPGTQLTMRTFHIGGAASRRVEQTDIRARVHGTIVFMDINVVLNAQNEYVVMNRRGGEFAIVSDTGRERERYPVIYGAHILVKNNQKVKTGDLLATWDPFTTPIITETDGVVKFGDIIPQTTLQEKVDPVTGKSSRTIIDPKSQDTAKILHDLRPRISIKDKSGRTKKIAFYEGSKDKSKDKKIRKTKPARYALPVNAIMLVEEGDEVQAGGIIAKLPRATTKTKDITGGLPRVAELFEVRKPKETAMLSEIDGYVSISRDSKKTKGKQKVIITPLDVGDPKEYLIPRGRHINVYEGDYVRAGEPLISGSALPQDILNIRGEVSLAQYLVDEVQEVYRLQGVRINDKHIEVIVRQMMRRVKIIDAGDTDFINEEQVDKIRFETTNNKVKSQGGQAARAEPLILGITKASLRTDSFISAASFQETTKVLTEASIAGAVDELKGLKENVIMGRLIPAGTGFPQYGDIEINV